MGYWTAFISGFQFCWKSCSWVTSPGPSILFAVTSVTRQTNWPHFVAGSLFWVLLSWVLHIYKLIFHLSPPKEILVMWGGVEKLADLLLLLKSAFRKEKISHPAFWQKEQWALAHLQVMGLLGILYFKWCILGSNPLRLWGAVHLDQHKYECCHHSLTYPTRVILCTPERALLSARDWTELFIDYIMESLLRALSPWYSIMIPSDQCPIQQTQGSVRSPKMPPGPDLLLMGQFEANESLKQYSPKSSPKWSL